MEDRDARKRPPDSLKHPAAEAACPLAAVDRRLADAHTLWHQAEASYFDPDGFRLAVQNAIQSLRSLTFILQNHKAVIPDFVGWYGDYVDQKHGKRGKWQERMHADPLMRWMVEARNRIEKRGDLESHSMVRAEIIASYYDDGPRIDIPAHLFENAETLLRGIPDNLLGQHIRRNGVLRIQRRWVENTLLDHELLDAVAIYYGKLTELVHDAHRQIGLDPPQTIHDEAGGSFDLPAMGWRFPCMVGHETPRALTISLADGATVEFETKSELVKIDAAERASLTDRYGESTFEALTRDYKSDAELAAGYFMVAQAMFLRDGYHRSILLLFRDRKLIKPIEIRTDNTQQKYIVMRQLADEVTKSGADAAILIGEVWIARADELKPYERPADSPVRAEGLSLDMVSKNGEPLNRFAKIVREGKKVSLTKSKMAGIPVSFAFAPFYQAWGRPIPQAWTDADRAILAAAKQ
jgi:hypothetical protein